MSQLGLTSGAARRNDRQQAFCPMVGGKMSYMSVGVNEGMV